MLRVKADPVADFSSIAPGRYLVAFSIGPEDDPIFLSVDRDPRLKGGDGVPEFARLRSDHPHGYQIHHLYQGVTESVSLARTVENYSFIQPLPDSRWLLARARAQEANDRNASIYDSAGVIVDSLHLGDGIEDVQTTQKGEIWVSYFDEGVFGDYIGSSGAMCFNSEGHPIFRYDDLAQKEGLPPIDDCYAMNVATGDDVWLYYYTKFPLVRLKAMQLAEHWDRIPIRGSHAFATFEDRVIFAGSYQDARSLSLLNLGDSFRTTVTDVQLVDASEHVVLFDDVRGRGPRLYLTKQGTAVHRIDLREWGPG
jgi:hypothetical protein